MPSLSPEVPTHFEANVVPALKTTSWTRTAQQPMPDSHAESKTMTADAESDCRQLSSRPERPLEDAKTLAAKFGVAERGKCLVNASPFASTMRRDFCELAAQNNSLGADKMCTSLFKDGFQNPIQLKNSDILEVGTFQLL